MKRLYQKLESRFSSKKPLLKIIRLIKPEVDGNKVLESLLPFLDGKFKSRPIIFHIDITSSVSKMISEQCTTCIIVVDTFISAGTRKMPWCETFKASLIDLLI